MMANVGLSLQTHPPPPHSTTTTDTQIHSSTSGSRAGEGGEREGGRGGVGGGGWRKREKEEGIGGERRGGGVFVSQEKDGGGEREPDVQETRGERREEKMERNHVTIWWQEVRKRGKSTVTPMEESGKKKRKWEENWYSRAQSDITREGEGYQLFKHCVSVCCLWLFCLLDTNAPPRSYSISHNPMFSTQHCPTEITDLQNKKKTENGRHVK